MGGRNERSLLVFVGVLAAFLLIFVDALIFLVDGGSINIDRYLNDEVLGIGITRIDIIPYLFLLAIIAFGIYVVVTTRDLWSKEPYTTITIGTLVTLFLIIIDVYLLFWRKKLWDPLEFLNDTVSLIDWKLMDIAHVLLWLAILFFGMIAYANLREAIEAPAGWLDFGIIIPVIVGLLVLIYNEWIALLFLILSGLQPFYFYAAIGKSESAMSPKKRAKKDPDGSLK